MNSIQLHAHAFFLNSTTIESKTKVEFKQIQIRNLNASKHFSTSMHMKREKKRNHHQQKKMEAHLVELHSRQKMQNRGRTSAAEEIEALYLWRLASLLLLFLLLHSLTSLLFLERERGRERVLGCVCTLQ